MLGPTQTNRSKDSEFILLGVEKLRFIILDCEIYLILWSEELGENGAPSLSTDFPRFDWLGLLVFLQVPVKVFVTTKGK